ncbi:MAG TPA: peptidylprolyl isomerase, partial [Blastocatellia bacterium]|nr:peptidylprolyl isomerase [Blastocatellia bacterium]
HGQMVQAFDQVAFSLKPGEVSGLVQSQFGIHIIKVEERKKGDPSDPKIHQEILGMLKQQKFQEKINDIINHSKVKIAEDFNIPSKPSNPAAMPKPAN